MKLVERTVELHGPEGLGAKPRPELIGPFLSRLPGTLQDTVRMGFLHSSRTRGRIPQSLERAASVLYLGHSAGPMKSTLLRFEVPSFGDVAPELFDQKKLWPKGPDSNQTSFDLLSASLRDVRGLVRNSDNFDHALLHRFSSYRVLFREGLENIVLPGAGGNGVERIDLQLTAAAESLHREIPPPRRVRLSGRLDLLRVSKRVIGLLLEDGTNVTSVWTAEGFVELADFLDKQVVIEGLAEFRPSGSLLRIDADAIRKAGHGDDAFSVMPSPDIRRDYHREAVSVRPGHSPYSSIFGFIPGEEPEEEFAAALEQLS